MSEMPRRLFFSFLALRAAEHAQSAWVSAVKTSGAFKSSSQGAAQCARCFGRFNPTADESLCSVCRDNEAKQQSLIAEISQD